MFFIIMYRGVSSLGSRLGFVAGGRGVISAAAYHRVSTHRDSEGEDSDREKDVEMGRRRSPNKNNRFGSIFLSG